MRGGCEARQLRRDRGRAAARRIEDDDVGAGEPVTAQEAVGGVRLEADVREAGGRGARGAVGDAAGILVDARRRTARRARAAGSGCRRRKRGRAPARPRRRRRRRCGPAGGSRRGSPA